MFVSVDVDDKLLCKNCPYRNKLSIVIYWFIPCHWLVVLSMCLYKPLTWEQFDSCRFQKLILWLQKLFYNNNSIFYHTMFVQKRALQTAVSPSSVRSSYSIASLAKNPHLNQGEIIYMCHKTRADFKDETVVSDEHDLLSVCLLENSCTDPSSPAEFALCIAHWCLAERTGSAVISDYSSGTPCELSCNNDVMIKRNAKPENTGPRLFRMWHSSKCVI